MESAILATNHIVIDHQPIYTVEHHRFPIGGTPHYQVRVWRHITPDYHLQTVATPDAANSRLAFDEICRVLDADEAPL